MDAGLVYKLFVHNDSKFGRQTKDENGKIIFIEIKETLTKEMIKKHLDGSYTLSVFPILDGKTKTFCIDIDILKSVYSKEFFKIEDYEEALDGIAENVKARLAKYDIPSYKEKTGGKGIHVWIFFDPPVHYQQIVRSLLPILEDVQYDKSIFDIEYFPTSETSKSVKLPGGRNLRWGDSIGQGAWSLIEVPLTIISTVSPKTLASLINPLLSVFTKCRALRELKEKADTEKNLKHKERTAIGTMLYKLDKQYIDFTVDYYFRGLENFDEDITRKNLTKLSEGYRASSCLKLQQDDICSGQCKEVGNGTNPMYFYYKEANTPNESDGIKEIINPQDSLVKMNNGFYEISKDNKYICLSDYIIDITHTEEISEDNADGTSIVSNQVFSGKLVTQHNEEYDFSMPLEKYAKDEALVAEIYRTLKLGGAHYIDPRKIVKIRQCVDKFSTPTKIKKTRNFGFTQDYKTYYTPSVKITPEAIIPNSDLQVDLNLKNNELESYLDLSLDSSTRGELFWKNFVKEKIFKLYLNNNIPTSVFGYIMDLFIRPVYDPNNNGNPYLLWLSGTTGMGKSRLLVIAQKMFGNFPSLYSFSSSQGRLEFSGHAYKDAIFAVDDFKLNSFTETTYKNFITLFQNYADKTGRSRLTKDIGTQRSYWVRGGFLVNGEDIVTRESSSIARMIILTVLEKDVIIDFKLFDDIQEELYFINEWTPHLIQWSMNLKPETVSTLRSELQIELQELTKGRQNGPRVAVNFAKLITSGMLFLDYLYSDNEAERIARKASFKEYMVTTCLYMLSLVEEESYATKYWNTLQELLAVGKVRVVPEDYHDENNKVPIVGFIKDSGLYILHNVAFKEVSNFLRNFNSINVSTVALARELVDRKFFTGEAVRKYFNGKQLRVYLVNNDKIKDLKLGEESKENKTSNSRKS